MFKKFIICLSAMVCLTLLIMPARGGMPPVLKKRIGIPPFKVLREVLATGHSRTTESKDFQEGVTPYLTWLADSDPRLSSNHILPGGKQMITVRNPGAQLSVSQGSLNYGIYQLHTPVLLITGISDSRHINYYLKGYNHLSGPLQMELDHLHLALDKEKEIDLEQERPAEKLLRLVETNVDYQVKKAIECFHERISDGRLVVIGSVFDTTNLYKKGKNRIIIININGEQGKKLRELRLIRQLEPELRQYVIRQN